GRNGPAPLMNVADVSLGAGPAEITRVNRSRNITIEASLQGTPLGDALALVQELPSMRSLPEGVRYVPTGDARWIVEIFGQFATAMFIGVLSIYAVLVMLFHRFIQPVTILSALPPSAGGAAVALYLAGHGLAINSLIGLLMLMGACSKRARPIVMTTIAMGAGMTPVAMGWAGDPSFRSPMGVAVIGGLVVSTAMSLFIVPALFTVFDDFQQWLGRLFQRGERDVPPEPVPAAG